MSQRASMAVAAVVLLMSVLAVSATGVSMSWFSDTESTDVDVTTETGSFLIDTGLDPDINGVYTLVSGWHSISVSGWPMKFQVVSGSLTIGESTVSAGSVFPLAIGDHNVTANVAVELKPL